MAGTQRELTSAKAFCAQASFVAHRFRVSWVWEEQKSVSPNLIFRNDAPAKHLEMM